MVRSPAQYETNAHSRIVERVKPIVVLAAKWNWEDVIRPMKMSPSVADRKGIYAGRANAVLNQDAGTYFNTIYEASF